MWRAIWNGPFYIGELTPPLSLGDVLMKVLETLWRGVICLLALALAVAVLVWLYSSYQHDRNEKARLSVAASARLNPAECTNGWPLQMRLRNNSRKTIRGLSYSIQAYQPGRTTDISAYGDRYVNLDWQVEPGRELLSCVAASGYENGAREWLVHIQSVRFAD